MCARAQKSTVTAAAIEAQKPKFLTFVSKQPHTVSDRLMAKTKRKAQSSFLLMRLMAAFWFEMIF